MLAQMTNKLLKKYYLNRLKNNYEKDTWNIFKANFERWL